MQVMAGLTGLSGAIWLGLLGLRGQFWRSDQVLEDQAFEADQQVKQQAPSVCAIIPARNEAELLPITLRSLLQQTHDLQIILVDDQSSDGTADVATQTAAALGKSDRLRVITARPLPAGWSGKLWAMQQGIEAAQGFDYLLLSDADICHDPENLQRLVALAQRQNLDMASVMVRLRCESFWEKLLIPAFVFFFELLYPFGWVNDPTRKTAAAAGGCILIKRSALDRIGGLHPIRQALIDDCALAEAIKRADQTIHPIWLGLSDRTQSLRPYPDLATIWDMVARTAFTQLQYSWILLAGTTFGMFLAYIAPLIGLIAGILWGSVGLIVLGGLSWGLMTLAYWPTVRFYRLHPVWALALPAIALLYTLMTCDSALRYWQGKGGAWKGRLYPVRKSGAE